MKKYEDVLDPHGRWADEEECRLFESLRDERPCCLCGAARCVAPDCPICEGSGLMEKRPKCYAYDDGERDHCSCIDRQTGLHLRTGVTAPPEESEESDETDE